MRRRIFVKGLSLLLLLCFCVSMALAERISLQDIKLSAESESMLPQKNPPRGSLKGGVRTKHTNLEFKRGKVDTHNYVFIIMNENNNAVEIGFMGAKDKACLLYAPVGTYSLIVGYGDTWYGRGHLFGKEGTYLKTGKFHIQKSNIAYTITLNAKDADIPAYEVDPKEGVHE